MSSRIPALLICIALVFSVASTASAKLILRGYGEVTSSGEGNGGSYRLIYDNVLDVTWLDYTKSAAAWQTQMTWAQNLVVRDVFGTSYTDWRLPVTDESKAYQYGGYGYEGPDEYGYHDYWTGYNMTNMEIGHLFYATLGNKGIYDTSNNYQSDFGLKETGPFRNLSNTWYWSNTAYSPNTYGAWYFMFDGGSQNFYLKTSTYSALAVLPGDVAQDPAYVPVPAAVWLLGSGLVGLAGLRRKLRG